MSLDGRMQKVRSRPDNWLFERRLCFHNFCFTTDDPKTVACSMFYFTRSMFLNFEMIEAVLTGLVQPQSTADI